MNGLINLNKPVGPSSFQMIAQLRRLTGERKLGHAGTLDPLASGVLPICVGKAVRLSEYLQTDHKVYEAEVTFGVRTTTDDAEGQVIARQPVTLTREEVESVLREFVGEQEQVPPQFAAIKIGGQPLYKSARRGQTIDVPPRHINIERLTLLGWDSPRAQVEVACSKGTYVRALARDIGERTGCGAYLSALTRTQCGAFSLREAVSVEALAGDWRAHLLPMDFGLQHWDAVRLDAAQTRRILSGLSVEYDQPFKTLVRAYDNSGHFFAVLKLDAPSGSLRPEKVFQDNR
jgi:tRNA pseudouridine55 synthase